MDEEEIAACNVILKQILSKPESQLFRKSSNDMLNPDIQHPLNLDTLISRFNQGKFKTAYLFIYTIQELFNNIKAAENPSSIRYAAATDFLNEIDSFLGNSIPSLPSKLLPIKMNYFKFKENVLIPKTINNQTSSQNECEKNPGSLIFDKDLDPLNLNLLTRDIQFLNSPNLTLRLAAFVSNLQPEAVSISDSFSLNLVLLTPENKVKLRNYVTSLLKAAAIGDIDPFDRPFGKKLIPIKIQERSMFLTPNPPSSEQQEVTIADSLDNFQSLGETETQSSQAEFPISDPDTPNIEMESGEEKESIIRIVLSKPS